MPITTQAPTTTTAAPIHLSARGQLKDYCLRRLGAPVIEINVDDQQVEDRVQDALEFFSEYHYDGVERTFIAALIQGSTIRTTTPIGSSFSQNEVIIGETSGAAAFFFQIVPAIVPNSFTPLPPDRFVPADPAFFYIYRTAGTFLPGETIQGQTSMVTGVIAPNGFVLGNWDEQFLTMPDNVMGISKVLPIGPATSSGMDMQNIFSPFYQFRLNDMYNLISADMTYYAGVKTFLESLELLFPGDRSTRFNRKMDKLFIDMPWYDVLIPGSYIVVEAFVLLDPEEYTKIYNDYFVKKYATALIKRQWGANSKKFDGIQLPGGVILNGQKIYDEAITEIDKLEDEIQLRFEEPTSFFVG